MAAVTFGAVSMRCEHDKERNLRVYREHIAEAAARGVQVLVFPEVSVQGFIRAMRGFFTPEAKEQVAYFLETAEPVPGPTTALIGELAARHRMYIQFGIAESTLGGTTLYNTAVLVGPDGAVIGKNRKVHNQPEQPVFCPGDGFPVWETPLGRFGQIICADLILAESVRLMALDGAEVVLMSTAWPTRADDPAADNALYKYDLLTRAQALMNQVWLVSSNQFGRSSSPRAGNYLGHSRIVGPDGQVVAGLGYEEGLVVATVDVQAGVRDARAADPLAFNRRRPELYGRLVER